MKKVYIIIISLLISLTSINNKPVQASTVFNNVDTLMIYNPLRFHEYSTGLSEQWYSKTTAELSTGDMSNTILQLSSGKLHLRSQYTNKILDYTYGNYSLYNAIDNSIEESNEYVFDILDESQNLNDKEGLRSKINLGDVKSFWTGSDLLDFKLVNKTNKSNIWVAVNDDYYNESLKYASQLALEVDNKVIASNHDKFGIGRFYNEETNDVLNVLVYDMKNSSYLGLTYLDDTLSIEDPKGYKYQDYNNLDMTLIHINSYNLVDLYDRGYEDLIFSTLAHEYQHQIAFSATYDNYYKAGDWRGNFISSTNITNNNFMETWLNELMSAASSEFIYPGSDVGYGYLYAYNKSSSFRDGQSIYNFNPNQNNDTISVYGAVGLLNFYLMTYSDDYLYKRIHNYWRNNKGQSEGIAFNIAAPALTYKLENLVEYNTYVMNQLNADYYKNKVNEVNLSKIILDFYIKQITQEIEYDGTKTTNYLYNKINPLVYTSNKANIEGGGRIIVKPNNDTYVVPNDADPNLIYVGFDSNGNITLQPTHAVVEENNDQKVTINVTDVNDATSHSASIYWLIENAISTGYKQYDGTFLFKPYENIARVDMAAFLYRFAKRKGLVSENQNYTNPFIDVGFEISTLSDHYKGIVWMASVGITTGWMTDKGQCFKPYDNLTRADMAAFLYRFAKMTGVVVDSYVDTLTNYYTDVNTTDFSKTSDHYKGMIWMYDARVSTGFVSGNKIEFRPYNKIVRCDMAAFLERFDKIQ